MKVVDLALILSRLADTETDPATEIRTLLRTEDTDYTLVSLAAGERWPTHEAEPATAAGDTTFLMLEGVATWVTGDIRQSLGSGHLIVLDAVTPLHVINDGSSPVVFVRVMAAP
ncbi:MAG: quercetin dioxygenase-like cupin family protein [Myxococcota bacterium]|jgi:quercetin dioxygenase-like cupin family protein